MKYLDFQLQSIMNVAQEQQTNPVVIYHCSYIKSRTLSMQYNTKTEKKLTDNIICSEISYKCLRMLLILLSVFISLSFLQGLMPF